MKIKSIRTKEDAKWFVENIWMKADIKNNVFVYDIWLRPHRYDPQVFLYTMNGKMNIYPIDAKWGVDLDYAKAVDYVWENRQWINAKILTKVTVENLLNDKSLLKRLKGIGNNSKMRKIEAIPLTLTWDKVNYEIDGVSIDIIEEHNKNREEV